MEDNSSDNTRDIAKKLKTFYSGKIEILEREKKMGLGSAYNDGFKLTTGNYIIIMDADLSHHPKYIPQMIQLREAQNLDIVLGSRYVEKGGIHGWTFFRKMTSRIANFITNQSLGADISDMTNSFRLYKRECFQELLGQVKTRGFGFQMEIIVKAQWNKKKIGEVPIVFVDRIFGESKLGLGEIKKFLQSIWDLMHEEHN